ncbi:MAG: hypothetical protein V4764_02835 [Burkholderia sp.]
MFYQASTLLDVIVRLVAHGEEDLVDLIGLCKLGINQLNGAAQRSVNMTKEIRHD